MASISEKATEALAAHLDPGETVVAATKAQLEGGSVRNGVSAGLTSVGGLIGAVAGIAMNRGGDDIDKQLRSGAVVVVTSKRVVICNVTALGANPKEPVLAVDRKAVGDIVTGTKRVMLIKIPTFGFTFPDDKGGKHAISFEVPKVQAREADAVVAALKG